MITSKLTAKAQTTIPQAVRRQLGLLPGDYLGFVIEGDRVVLCRPPPALSAREGAGVGPLARPVLAEWESEVDERAYDGL